MSIRIYNNNMKKELDVKNAILTSIATILLLFILLVTSFQAVGYWIPGWFRHEYDKHNSVAYVNGEISLDDVVYVSDQVMYYCAGKVNTLEDVKATIDGKEVLFFTDRELIHLVDCRNIITGLFKLRIIAILLFIACVALLYILKAKRKTVARVYLGTTAVVLGLTTIIVFIASINFNTVFVKFHELFFNNDYWILDPYKDNLVNIMREGMFQDTAALIAGIWIAVIVVVSLLAAKNLKADKAD